MTVNPVQEAQEAAVLAKASDVVQDLLNELKSLKTLLQNLENLHGTITPQEMENEYSYLTSQMQALIGGSHGQAGISTLLSEIQNAPRGSYAAKWRDNNTGAFQGILYDVFTASESKDPGKTLAGEANNFNGMATFLADMCTDIGKGHIVDLLNEVNTILGQ